MRILVNFYCWFLIEGESFDKFLKSLLFALSTSKNWTLAKLLTVISKKGASEFCLCNKIRLVFNIINTSCLVTH